MLRNFISRSGQIIIITLAAIPLLFWLPFASFSTYSAVWLSLGQFTALSGYALFCLNFILSARLKFLEPFFSGLPRIYVFHHLVGAAAFIFLLFHPLTIAVSYLAISLQAAASLLIPNTQNLPLYFGILALIFVIVLLVITLYVKLEYDTWKLTHKFLGLALFFASIHVFFIGSTLSASPPLKLYLFALTVAGLGSVIYRTLFPKFLVRFRSFTVSRSQLLTPDILEITLASVGSQPFSFSPGQFIFIKPVALGIARQSHPFSLVSASGSSDLSFASKVVGDYTETLRLVKPGTPVQVEGPFGRFSYAFFPAPRQIWIAGGIGITPFVSLARSLPSPSPIVDLYYSVKDPSEAVYADVFSAISASNPNFHFHLHDTKKQGRLAATTIAGNIPDAVDRDIFVCGPPPMMAAIRTQFRSLGVKNTRIHSEEFALYEGR